MKVLFTEKFRERYQKLPVAIQRKIEKQRSVFEQNPFHPSLHTEKLEPKHRAYWSFRVDQNYRVIFRFIDASEVLLMTVGTHDYVYKFV